MAAFPTKAATKAPRRKRKVFVILVLCEGEIKTKMVRSKKWLSSIEPNIRKSLTIIKNFTY